MKLLLSLLVLFAVVGCGGVDVSPNPEPVSVTVNVSMGGSPVDGLKFNFQPIEGGLPAVVEIKKGTFSSQVTPGTYTWFISGSESDLASKKIPASYLEGSMDRKVTVKGGDTIEAKLD
ncbi:MAG: hypothetical protein WCK86_00535 [Planctomycetia bacterium]